jgi:hypothetical protein
MTLSERLRDHFATIAALYPQISPGTTVNEYARLAGAEAALVREMQDAGAVFEDLAAELGRVRPLRVALGRPKGAWAHVYYVSLHDPINSSGPTEGFYPTFLLSVDSKVCWLSVLLAAASVGISGRGGWSGVRGAELRRRARFLGEHCKDLGGWVRGPIQLGPNRTFLHAAAGSDRPAGRAYECGAIISKAFPSHSPPEDLATWLGEAFAYFDAIIDVELKYLESAVPSLTDEEEREQANAIITGRKAEEFFRSWVTSEHPDWGAFADKTDTTGAGYDFAFADHVVEVKGFKGSVDDIRMTEKELAVAKERGPSYALALVSELDGRTKVSLIWNPWVKIGKHALQSIRVQVSYLISGPILKRVLDAT